jgi:hypothetical protein
MRFLGFCCAAVVAAGMARAAPLPLQVSLRAESHRTIPGIPIDVRIVITNPTDTEVELPGHDIMLRVERAGQAPFWAFDGIAVGGLAAFRLQPCSTDGDEWPLAAHTSIEYALDGSPSGEKSWWQDPRLNVPGIYRLQVVFDPPAWAMRIGKRPDDVMSDAALGPDALISKPFVVTVDEPRGDDALVWERLSAAVHDPEMKGVDAVRESSRELATALLEAHPQSRYAPWLAHRLAGWGDESARDEFRRKYGRSPLADDLDHQILLKASNAVALLGKDAKPADIAAVRSRMAAFLNRVQHPWLRCEIRQELKRLDREVKLPPLRSATR